MANLMRSIMEGSLANAPEAKANSQETKDVLNDQIDKSDNAMSLSDLDNFHKEYKSTHKTTIKDGVKDIKNNAKNAVTTAVINAKKKIATPARY